MLLIYHIATQENWSSAIESGDYRPASLESEGFTHCSTDIQVAPVANAFYAGQTGLVLLVIDPKRLSAKLQWDPPAHPDPAKAPVELRGDFPHIYGPLNLDAVIYVLDFSPDERGEFSFPSRG
jgi:uncharacterized protein (DUF952 family)